MGDTSDKCALNPTSEASVNRTSAGVAASQVTPQSDDESFAQNPNKRRYAAFVSLTLTCGNQDAAVASESYSGKQ